MGLAWGWHGVGMGRMGPHGDKPTGPQAWHQVTRSYAAGGWQWQGVGSASPQPPSGPATRIWPSIMMASDHLVAACSYSL
jgi:hypothetical protein